MYEVFAGQKKPPKIFSFESPKITLPTQQNLELELPEGMALPDGVSLPRRVTPKNQVSQQELELFSGDVLSQVTNMSIYLLLMGFIASSGAKIASIGVRMIKDIKVVVKEEKIRQATQEIAQ